MPVSISRRILRSFGSLGVGRCSSPCLTYQLFLTSLDVCGRVSGDCLFFAESSSFIKGGAASLTYRRFSTSILTPGSSDGAFPSDLFSTKTVLTPEGNIGLGDSGDKFHNEDKGFMVLGTHSTKTISEVSGTGRKPYQQKGTGRARHGKLRGPQFRVGAAMHGPEPQSRCNKKVWRLGLKIALTAQTAKGKAWLCPSNFNFT